MTRAGAVLAALALTGGCDTCGLIRQQVSVTPDEELAPLTAACAAALPKGYVAVQAQVEGCLPLCRRIYEIVDPDPKRPALERCLAAPAADGRWAVTIEYRTPCS